MMTKDELFQALKEIHEICKNRMASMMDCKSCLFFDNHSDCKSCIFIDGGEEGLIPAWWEIGNKEVQDDGNS